MAMNIVAIPHDNQSAAPASQSLSSAYGWAILGWVLSAGVYIAAKWATVEMPPWALCFWRLALACLILLPLVRHQHAAMMRLMRERFLHLLLVAALGLTLCQGFIYTGLHYADATTAGIIMSLAPILTMVLASVLLDEALGVWQGVGAGLALIGMAVIVSKGDLDALIQLKVNPGELWVVASALCWGLYTVLLRRMKFAIERLPLLVLLLGLGALAALPMYFWEFAQGEHSAIDTKGLLALAYVAVPGGAFMYLLYNRSVDTLGAGRAGMLMYLQALFVAILAYFILGESLHAYDFAGAALIVAGLVLANILKPKPKRVV
jgi:drug/metabolite transporter (DMT)-like permease